jgi:hypothetical protein
VGAGGEPAHVRARLGDDAPGGAAAQPGMDSACSDRAAQVPAAIAYGPQVAAIFGHSYRAGDAVMVTLPVAMLLGTAFGQADVVLITSGRSSWSPVNALSSWLRTPVWTCC